MKISSLKPIIISDNTEKTMEFYASLGFTTKHSSITDMGDPAFIIANDDVEIEIMESPENAHVPMPAGLYGLRMSVDDIEAAVEAVKQNGGTVVAGPFENPSAKIYAVKDVDGNNIAIMQHIKK